MRREVRTAIRALALPTFLLLFTVAVVPGRLPLAIRVYALLLCAVAVGLALLALRRAYPPPAPLRAKTEAGSGRRTPPPTLARLEDEVALGVAGAFHLHFRLVPRLRSIAAGLLLSRRRVRLDSEPVESRRILGDETWELVRPDRPAPVDRQARGIPAESLARVVGSLEAS